MVELVRTIGRDRRSVRPRRPSAIHAAAAALALFALSPAPGRAEEEILVASGTGVTVHPRTVQGNVAPARRLAGPGTALGNVGGIAVDRVNGEMIVASSSGIQVFLLDAGGNVAPVRVINGAASLLTGPFGVAVDPVNDEIIVADSGGVGNVLVYPRKAHGDVAPLRSFTFNHGALQPCLCPIGVFADPAHGEIIVTTDVSILAFARTATGATAPLRMIAGFATGADVTGLDFPEGVFVNNATDEIIVAQTSTVTPSIRFYARTANGNVPPLRTIAGPATGLLKPVGLDVDLAHGEIVVSDINNSSVAAFALGAAGNTPPIRRIQGPATGLGTLQLLALSPGPTPSGPAVVQAAVLPAGRSVVTGTAASAFATMINTGLVPATNCEIAQLTSLPATLNFSYVFQTTDPATNQPTGTPNTPVTIPANAVQTFFFAFTPLSALAVPPTDIELAFHCANTARAAIVSGLNTLLFSASPTPVPDIVALAATLEGNGIVDIPGATGAGAFSVATANVGATASITVSADTVSAAAPAALPAALPVSTALCQTDPASGQCISAIGSTVTANIAAGQTPTFAVFVTGLGEVAFDPANNRVIVQFTDAGGVVRGATSVAVRTTP